MSYRRIGDLIQLVDQRNKDLAITHLVGLTINKKFIPSVANTIGTDMANYKLIRKNQFACSTMQVRRDKKIPIALLKELDIAIISQAYPVFEVIDENLILPDYLMLWFSRSEFDREACFHAVGGVRGSLEWEDFCGMQLPVPSIEEQRQIVAQYQSIANKIKVNEQICEKLEAAAQALYKHWFVDFEFPYSPPSEGGAQDGVAIEKPYKSSGGKMVWNEELGKEIPEGWEVSSLTEITEDTIGGDWGKEVPEGNYTSEVLCIRGTDIPTLNRSDKNGIPQRYILEKNLKSRKLTEGNIVVEISGGSPTQATGRTVLIDKSLTKFINKDLICSNFCRVISVKTSFENVYHLELKRNYNNGLFFTYENSSNGVKNLALNDLLSDLKIAYNNTIVNKFDKHFSILSRQKFIINNQNYYLLQLQSLLLSRLAVGEAVEAS
ncbi:restriction endonuclease subunit S [Chryseobacterium gambrini]|uniref:Restriction endonuclease subunit S n=1 Tax=Chryseobacterium gambrini TaxID=373672 RepID=A0AAJ1R531_9FLAO|nr:MULTISPECIES: restriction endonuclease subunit S [Chryseobacterium]MDN4013397.1 restriction endonuclease subunit S [Chryseobacterium gambrini]MDN4031607.1 restriction endonuclease subunit S [Chryseobacterium gambrini]QWA39469.1 restriction endonuclease subunit S [Chryseobacterium sp. ZHDP1]